MGETKKILLEGIRNYIVANPIKGIRRKLTNPYLGLASYFLEQTVQPRDLDLTYSTIKHWETKGYLILPSLKDTDEWRKYTIIEALWFALLNQVQDIGGSLEKIAPQLINTYKKFNSPNDTIILKPDIPAIVTIDGIEVSPAINFLNHTLLIILDKARATINLNKHRANLFLDKKDGDVLQAANKAYQNQYTTGINICISDIVFGLVLRLQNALQHLHIFNEAEITVFKAIINKNDA